jgi:hypothetical protein
MRNRGSARDVAAVPSIDRQLNSDKSIQVLERKLEAIAPKNLGAIWPSIRDEVMSIDSPDCIAEDVYSECKANHASLFLIHVNGERIGWMVLKVIGGVDLHIWMLHAKNGYDVLTVFRDDLMDMAGKANVQALTFGTKRRGWDKVAPKHGFTVRSTIFECPVTLIP